MIVYYIFACFMIIKFNLYQGVVSKFLEELMIYNSRKIFFYIQV